MTDEDPLECPGCGCPPALRAVDAGTLSPCGNEDCRVQDFRWWPNADGRGYENHIMKLAGATGADPETVRKEYDAFIEMISSGADEFEVSE